MDSFDAEIENRLSRMAGDESLKAASRAFLNASISAQYSYNFKWMGVPIIQYPQDIVAFQELVWEVRPDVIVETGIARGGSLSLSASLLALLDMIEAGIDGVLPKTKRRVIGVDIDIRPHTRSAIAAHPLSDRIEMFEGSSIDTEVVDQVRAAVGNAKRVMVCLDSHHGHDHVLSELEAYAPLVSVGSYCIVFDTVIDDLDEPLLFDRPWGAGDNPKTAVHQWIKDNPGFAIQSAIDDKLQVSVAPSGFLKRMR